MHAERNGYILGASILNLIWKIRKLISDLCTARYGDPTADLRQPVPCLQRRCDVPLTCASSSDLLSPYSGKRDLPACLWQQSNCFSWEAVGWSASTGRAVLYDPTPQCDKSSIALPDSSQVPSKMSVHAWGLWIHDLSRYYLGNKKRFSDCHSSDLTAWGSVSAERKKSRSLCFPMHEDTSIK